MAEQGDNDGHPDRLALWEKIAVAAQTDLGPLGSWRVVM